MLMHKDAIDLKPGDAFSMAGAHYEITYIYEVDDESMIKIAFAPLLGDYRAGTMTVKKTLLFMTL